MEEAIGRAQMAVLPFGIIHLIKSGWSGQVYILEANFVAYRLGKHRYPALTIITNVGHIGMAINGYLIGIRKLILYALTIMQNSSNVTLINSNV